jgi:hypothetical protein
MAGIPALMAFDAAPTVPENCVTMPRLPANMGQKRIALDIKGPTSDIGTGDDEVWAATKDCGRELLNSVLH